MEHPCQPHQHGRSGHETSIAVSLSQLTSSCNLQLRDGFTSQRSLNRSVGSSSTTTRVHAFFLKEKLKTFLYGAQLQERTAGPQSPRLRDPQTGTVRDKLVAAWGVYVTVRTFPMSAKVCCNLRCPQPTVACSCKGRSNIVGFHISSFYIDSRSK